jgi:molybdate transport system substrate-binding protein
VRRASLGGLLVCAFLAAPAAQAAPSDAISGTVTVLAASSLTEALTAMEQPFERKYPDVDLTFSFGSSSTLATQIEQQAPVDVFASADEPNMQRLVDDELVEEGAAKVFARNRLAIAVAPGNPQKIKTLADTVAEDITLVLCARDVPCGKYALRAYEQAGINVPPVPTGASTKDTLAKVTLGEADAAVVYVTDVRAAKDDVDGVKIPREDNVIAIYPIAPLVGAPNPAAARAFIRYVDSKAGRKALKRFGFLEP